MIKPEFIKKETIWSIVEEFRSSRTLDLHSVPVQILELVELDLKFEIIPTPDLLEGNNIDGFLLPDMNRIYVDEAIYYNECNINRLRFMFAHEVGHLALHADKIKECEFNTLEEWIELRLSLPEEDLKWFEWQAYEFAGRLLVPLGELKSEVHARSEDINKYFQISESGDTELLAEFLAVPISKIFRVSEGVIVRRIKSEGVLQDYMN